MTSVARLRAGVVAIGLAVVAFMAIGPRDPDADQSGTVGPLSCTSCDARHAAMADTRAASARPQE